MTRKICLALIFATALVTNFSFTSKPAAQSTPISTVDKKSFIVVCLYTGGCRYCGGVMWDANSTTICASSLCPGQFQSICITFSSKINPVTSKYEVDDTTINISYSDPAVKAVTDETALKADFIQQVNAQLP